MLEITQSEALEALKESDPMGRIKYSIVNKTPDMLGKLGVFTVTMWDGDFFEAPDVMFERKNGKVQVYSGV
ncbi:hypothetical protein SEA_ATUIN_205 [Arthrobacter phage Atuin]|nr:hypothetical protein SEA_ATUIN_4 [Arthrobacter phage Atuin]